jgi:hypothetical protein
MVTARGFRLFYVVVGAGAILVLTFLLLSSVLTSSS